MPQILICDLGIIYDYIQVVKIVESLSVNVKITILDVTDARGQNPGHCVYHNYCSCTKHNRQKVYDGRGNGVEMIDIGGNEIGGDVVFKIYRLRQRNLCGMTEENKCPDFIHNIEIRLQAFAKSGSENVCNLAESRAGLNQN